MSLILLTALVLPTAAPVTGPELSASALERLEQLETGTLLFSQGDCLAVRLYSWSRFTHVAAIVRTEQGESLVYDSENGIGVRRQPLAEYLAARAPDELYVCVPARAFSAARAERFQTHLENEIGRPYDLKHSLTGTRADGLHCAEYVTDALVACGVIRVARPSRVSPKNLRESLMRLSLYDETLRVSLTPRVPDEPQVDHWCERLWDDTKDCTRNCCDQLGRWFLCRG